MATDTEAPAAIPTASPTIELTVNAIPTDATTEKKDNPECTCGAAAKPAKLERKDTAVSVYSTYSSDDDYQPRGGRARRRVPDSIMINSSTVLLSKVGMYDGVADLPGNGYSRFYLTTFPFTDKDVKKWTWLLSRGVEDQFLNEHGNDDDDIYPAPVRNPGRNCSPYSAHVSSVYVSRALDSSVIPDDTKENVRYMIVVQDPNRPQGSKLLVAEGRKAAGIRIYYEALSRNSILFVGAVLDKGKRLGKKKLVRVESLEEAVKLQNEEGVVGVIC